MFSPSRLIPSLTVMATGLMCLTSSPPAQAEVFRVIIGPPNSYSYPQTRPSRSIIPPLFPSTVNPPGVPYGGTPYYQGPRNSTTLINPTIINSTIVNPTLVNPTVINSTIINQPGYATWPVTTQLLVGDTLNPAAIAILQTYNLAHRYRYYRPSNNTISIQIEQQSWLALNNTSKTQILQGIGNLYASPGTLLLIESFENLQLGQFTCYPAGGCSALTLF